VSAADGTDAERDIYFSHHQGHFNWCAGTYPIVPGYGEGISCLKRGCDAGLPPGTTRLPLPPELWQKAPTGVVLAVGNPNSMPSFFSGDWPTGKRSSHSFGREYLCPLSCSVPQGTANGTHMFGVPWAEVFRTNLNCPFW